MLVQIILVIVRTQMTKTVASDMKAVRHSNKQTWTNFEGSGKIDNNLVMNSLVAITKTN